VASFDLATIARRARNPRRKSITLRDIIPPAVLATDLYRGVYSPVVAIWSRAAERVIAEYERSLSALTTDAPVDIQRLLDEADGEFSRILILLSAALNDWSLRIERWQRGKWRGAVLSATGVDLETLIGPADVRQTLQQYIEWNTSLVKDVSAQARQRIGAAAFSGLTQRLPARDVAKTIREAVGMSRRRSINIASDQLSKLSSALADERRREAGLEEWEWVHSRKLHPRASHVERNGKIYSDANPPPTMPGIEPFCGCRQRARINFS
jgi:hypothetical protein